MSAQAALELLRGCGPRRVPRGSRSRACSGRAAQSMWIITDPIYVGRSEQPPPADSRPPARAFTTIYDNGPAAAWQIEAGPQSAGAIDTARAEGGGTQLRWRYALGGTRSDGPYVALVVVAGSAVASADRVIFSARADKPMRLAMQVRVPEGQRESGGSERSSSMKCRARSRCSSTTCDRGARRQRSCPPSRRFRHSCGWSSHQYSPWRQRTSLAR